MHRTLLGSKFQNTLHQFPSPWSFDPSPSLANFPFLLPSTNWRKALRVYDSGQLFLVIVSFHLYSVVCWLGTQDLGQFFPGLLELSLLLLHKHCDFIFFLHFWLFLASFFSFGYQNSFDTLATKLMTFPGKISNCKLKLATLWRRLCFELSPLESLFSSALAFPVAVSMFCAAVQEHQLVKFISFYFVATMHHLP